MSLSKNQLLAKIFYQIADYLEMEEIAFKPQAYQKAALILESLEQDIEDIYKQGGLKKLEAMPGIGKSIAQKIAEYLKTGKIKYYQKYKDKFPIDLREIVAVQGMGPKKAKTLYQKLAIKNLSQLEEAARNNKIAPLFGFGGKTEKNILEGIIFLKKSKGRFIFGEIWPLVESILNQLGSLKEVDRISPAGSLRRKKETVGDVDILITTKNSEKVMDFFTRLPGVVKVWMKGPTKSSIRIDQGIDIDLRVVKKKSYGSALQYFTGSKDHNIFLRKVAIERGLKLSEYGLFKENKMIAGWNEDKIYQLLGLSWIEPELREGQGEIEAAQKGNLPALIRQKDIRGDLHCHTNWSGGEGSIKEMVSEALEMGYQYLGIADHTKFLKIENGLDEKRLLSQKKEIEKINLEFALKKGIKVLHGCEANILNDGTIDIKDDVLRKMDFVIAGVHSSFQMPEKKMTQRIIRAIKNPLVDIISHPTGRIIKRRDEYNINFAQILRVAKEYRKVLEVNSYPSRLDLNEKHIRQAKESGVRMVINSDCHRKGQLKFVEFGVNQARRGWAEKEDIINSYSLEKLLTFFKND